MSDSRAISVKILEKEYLVGCTEDEHRELLASAQYLDRKMREIRDSGKVVGVERIAVMAALNIAHELLAKRESDTDSDGSVRLRIRQLHDRIEHVLIHARSS